MTSHDRWAFQSEAVKAIQEDFHREPTGRFLLVIPTGGGKTRTAVRSVHALYDDGTLDDSAHRVMWIAHREELLNQAKQSFDEYERSAQIESRMPLVDFVMLSGAANHLHSHPECTFVIIDEAHHGAAPSYQPVFEKPSLGVLGLTATPSRHDGKPLQFQRESYSIGFPDLVELGVLLRPEIIQIRGGTYLIKDLDDDDALSVLNNDERNQNILAAIASNQGKLRKVIVYVGTVQHAADLYQLLKASDLRYGYDSIAYITGADRRRYLCSEAREVAEDRRDFFAAQKATSRSILVNVDVLTEGYDDPAINSVVMARPTRSKLVYMQAAGRAIRLNPDHPDKNAYILEVVDDLPNVRYRIDNRWLYSDISDLLEPAVVDIRYGDPEQLTAEIERVFLEFNVRPSQRTIPVISEHDRVTMLLAKAYAGKGAYFHLPIVITNANRSSASALFNFLAARMESFNGGNAEQVFAAVQSDITNLGYLQTASDRRLTLEAMENAWLLTKKDIPMLDAEALNRGAPWLTFVTFRLRRADYTLGDDILLFTEDMLNREEIRETLLTESYTAGYYLAKLPLPLSGTTGAVLPPDEFSSIHDTVESLRGHKAETDPSAQFRTATEILGNATLPVEHRYHQGLTTIVREDIDYYRILSR